MGTSLDGVTFTAAEDAVVSAGPHATAFRAREARWVRITGLERRSFPSGRRAGISFWSVGVFGPVEPPPVVQAAPPAAPPAPAAAAPARRRLMSPFPVVRIRGRVTPRGARVSRLSVRAPRGARVEVRCRGRGCPRGRIAVRSRGVVRVRRLRRTLGAGAVLEVLVTRRGAVGKYTRFRIRRGRAPVRTDACARFGALTPRRCPRG